MPITPLRVFGYGSLLWNPGFPFVRRELAVARGYARSFCMWSIHHRGSVQDPGLVLALDKVDGASCAGAVFEVPEEARDQTLADLRERELVSSAYLEQVVEVELPGGQVAEALTYIVDPDHVQYCGGLPLDRQAQVIAHAIGGRGPNHEYLTQTVQHLNDMGIPDPELQALVAMVEKLRSA